LRALLTAFESETTFSLIIINNLLIFGLKADFLSASQTITTTPAPNTKIEFFTDLLLSPFNELKSHHGAISLSRYTTVLRNSTFVRVL
jgi:hypothetical protein